MGAPDSDPGSNRINEKEETKLVFVPHKVPLYNSLRSHGYNLPSLKSPIVTKPLLVEVKSSDCFMFKTEMVEKVNVLFPPPAAKLQEIVVI